jgi:hypothetical protein
MPYNRTLEYPEVKKEPEGGCTYTHNHAGKYSYDAGDAWTLKTRKEARAFVAQARKEINMCMFFSRNCLKDQTLTGVQRAILEQSIKNDEDLIQQLEDSKPSACSIS